MAPTFPLFLVLSTLCTVAIAALAPRTSPTPAAGAYHVRYPCPPGPASDVYLYDRWSLDLFQNAIACEYARGPSESTATYYGLCKYAQADGSTFIGSEDWCPPHAVEDSGCGPGCPLTDAATPTAPLVILSSSASALQCSYNTSISIAGWHWYGCGYNKMTGAGTSSERTTCPQRLESTCASSKSKRRFRGEDNYTAWIRKRTLRGEQSGKSA